MKKTKIIIIAILIAGVITAGAVIAKILLSRNVEEVTDPVETATIERKDLTQSLTLAGSVQSGATYSITSPITDVEIKTVNVKAGDRVHKGDVIAVLDSKQQTEKVKNAKKSLSFTKKKNTKDLNSAKKNLKNAEADQKTTASRGEKDVTRASNDYSTAQSELTSAKKAYTTATSKATTAKQAYDSAVNAAKIAHTNLTAKEREVEEKQKSTEEAYDKYKTLRDDPEADPTKVAAALAAYEAEKANYIQALNELDNYKALIEAETKAAEAYQAATTTETEAKSGVKTAEDSVKLTKLAYEKAKEDRDDANKTAKRSVEEQKDTLSKLKLSIEESVIAPTQDVKTAQDELNNCTIVAETDGVITSVPAKAGSIYKGDAIAIIDDDTSYRVSATADQYDISSLKENQDAEITINGANMENTEGKLIHVAKAPTVAGEESQATEANYKVEVLIKEPNDNIRIGMNAKVIVNVWSKPNCLCVPDKCIQQDENGQRYIEVLLNDTEKKRVDVQYGMKTDLYSEIICDNLQEGMEVIIPSALEEEENAD